MEESPCLTIHHRRNPITADESVDNEEPALDSPPKNDAHPILEDTNDEPGLWLLHRFGLPLLERSGR